LVSRSAAGALGESEAEAARRSMSGAAAGLSRSWSPTWRTPRSWRPESDRQRRGWNGTPTRQDVRDRDERDCGGAEGSAPWSVWRPSDAPGPSLLG